MITLTDEEMEQTSIALREYILPNYSKLKNKYEKMEYFLHLKRGYIGIKCNNHLHKIYVTRDNQDNLLYKVVPYKKSYYTTPIKSDYSGFKLAIFAIWELYNSSV